MANNRGGNNRQRAGQRSGQAPRPSGKTNTARRQPNRVPPLDAFESTPKRSPPNLPGQPGFDPARPNTYRQTGEPASPAAGRNGAKGGSTQRKPGKSSKKIARKGAARPASAKRRRPKKAVSPARRRRRRFIAVVVTAFALIAAGVWFSMAVLFKIEGYIVEGESRYTQEELVLALGTEIGDNMFSFDAGGTAKTMRQTMPYLESLRIQRKFPGTVVFHVTEAVESYTLQWNGQYAVLSESLKVLRMADDAPGGLVELYGLSDLTVQPGLPLSLALTEEDSYNPYQQLPQPPEPIPRTEEPAEPEGPDTPDATDPEGGEGEGEDPEAGGAAADNEAEAPPEEPAAGEDDPAADPPDEGAQDAGEGENGNTPGDEPGEGDESEAPAEPEEAPAPVPQELASPQERMEALEELLALLEGSELEDIDWINVTDTLNLTFRWEDRITVVLGARSALEDKLRVAIVMMTDRQQSDIGENERGTIDVSGYTSTLRGYFTPE